jgi:outer membrane protein TolC
MRLHWLGARWRDLRTGEVTLRAWGRLALVLLLFCGCTRTWYRNSADRETYSEVQERNDDPRWQVEHLSVYGDPRARFYDPFNPDHPPMPPDDPAADQFMIRADGIRGYSHWHKDGDAPWIEDPAWRDSLDLDKEGALVLKRDDVVKLGFIQSRDYQTQLETLYLSALSLTLNRFDFALHWFLTNGTIFQQFGSTETGINNLTTTTSPGFTRNLAWGGQLMVDFANSYVFQFSGLHHAVANTNFAVQLTQPLLRNAGKDFRMEALTEGERTLLYQLRSFARFRKTFAVQEGTSTFLNLLVQEQAIRNQRDNVKTLDQSYRLHEALLAAGVVSGVQVDQVFQQLQQGRATLIQREAQLESSLDLYKISLGLPPSLNAKIDDSLLKQFELASPELTNLQKNIEKLQAAYRELDQPPTRVMLEDAYKRLQSFHAQTLAQAAALQGEIERWRNTPPAADEEQAEVQRERASQEAQVRDLADTNKDLERLGKALTLSSAEAARAPIATGLEMFQKQSDALVGAVAELYVIQTQVRVYQIRLKPVYFNLQTATEYASKNRLDLMNENGRVVDAWRQLAVTANQLKAGLNVVFDGNLNTQPGSTNPIDFRQSASVYSIGFQFDGPLNRLAERNAYRASQIAYQQERRTYMALDDEIQRTVRLDLRSLRADRLNFDITRQSLISVARSVEAAREKLVVEGAANPTSTLDILNALTNLLTAENSLISNWVSYEQDRIQLLLDTEALQVDEQGMYHDEYDHRNDQPPSTRPDPGVSQAAPQPGAS